MTSFYFAKLIWELAPPWFSRSLNLWPCFYAISSKSKEPRSTSLSILAAASFSRVLLSVNLPLLSAENSFGSMSESLISRAMDPFYNVSSICLGASFTGWKLCCFTAALASILGSALLMLLLALLNALLVLAVVGLFNLLMLDAVGASIPELRVFGSSPAFSVACFLYYVGLFLLATLLGTPC